MVEASLLSLLPNYRFELACTVFYLLMSRLKSGFGLTVLNFIFPDEFVVEESLDIVYPIFYVLRLHPIFGLLRLVLESFE